MTPLLRAYQNDNVQVRLWLGHTSSRTSLIWQVRRGLPSRPGKIPAIAAPSRWDFPNTLNCSSKFLHLVGAEYRPQVSRRSVARKLCRLSLQSKHGRQWRRMVLGSLPRVRPDQRGDETEAAAKQSNRRRRRLPIQLVLRQHPNGFSTLRP